LLRFQTNVGELPEPGSEVALPFELGIGGETSEARGSKSSRSGLGTDNGANIESGRDDDAMRTVAAATLYAGSASFGGRWRGRLGRDSSSKAFVRVEVVGDVGVAGRSIVVVVMTDGLLLLWVGTFWYDLFCLCVLLGADFG